MMRLFSLAVFSVLLAMTFLAAPLPCALQAADPSRPDHQPEVIPASVASASSAAMASPLYTSTIDHLAKGCVFVKMAVTGPGQCALRTFYGGLLEKAEGPQAVTNTEQACEHQLSIDTLFEQMERGIQRQEEWQREKIDYSLSLTRVGFRALQHLKSQKLAHLTLASSPLSYYDIARLHLPSLKTLFYDVNGDPLVTYWHQSFFFPKLPPHVHIGANSPLLSLDRTLCEGNRCIVLSCLPLLAYAGQDYGHQDMGKPSFKKEHPLVKIKEPLLRLKNSTTLMGQKGR